MSKPSPAERNILAAHEFGDAATAFLKYLPVSDEVRRETPDRVCALWRELLGGYELDPVEVLGTVFDHEPYDEVIVVRGIEFASVCEHHLLPFQGTADVGYLPEGNRIVGLSKLARLVDCFAHRLQIQERLTQQIATALNDHVRTAGVAVVIRAQHACMGCRGVRQPNSSTVTSVMTGKFREDAAARAEVLELIRL